MANAPGHLWNFEVGAVQREGRGLTQEAVYPRPAGRGFRECDEIYAVETQVADVQITK